MNVSYETIGALADLSPGYSNKLFAPRARVHAGSRTLDALLVAAGLELHVVVNEKQLERIKQSHAYRARSSRAPYSRRHADPSMRAARKRAANATSFTADTGKVAQARWMLKSKPTQRRRWAKAAALARWGSGRRVCKEVGAPAA
jgi:hypothetical protein